MRIAPVINPTLQAQPGPYVQAAVGAAPESPAGGLTISDGVLAMRAADHAPVGASVEDLAHLREVMSLLGRSPTGRALLEELSAGKVPVQFADAQDLWSARAGGHAAGMYVVGQQRIVLSRDLPPAQAALTLAHEAQHHFDARFGNPPASLLGEARAFRTQAIVARELGLADRGYGTAPDGRVRSLNETFAALQHSDFYARTPLQPAGSAGPALVPGYWATRLAAAGGDPAGANVQGLSLSASPARRTATTFDRTPVEV